MLEVLEEHLEYLAMVEVQQVEVTDVQARLSDDRPTFLPRIRAGFPIRSNLIQRTHH